jgi:hypothetical protein
MNGYRLTYRLIVCSPKLYRFKITELVLEMLHIEDDFKLLEYPYHNRVIYEVPQRVLKL